MKKQKTWETLEVNDLIQDSDGDRKTILAKAGRLIFISNYDNQDEAGNMYTKEDLIKWGYTIVQDKEEEKEVPPCFSSFCQCQCHWNCLREQKSCSGCKQTGPLYFDSIKDVSKEEDLKKLIEETKQELHNFIYKIEGGVDELKDLLAKWKGVEVEKIKYIK